MYNLLVIESKGMWIFMIFFCSVVSFVLGVVWGSGGNGDRKDRYSMTDALDEHEEVLSGSREFRVLDIQCN